MALFPERRRRTLATGALIVAASALLAVLADWRAPGIARSLNDWLMRERGPLPVPQEIAIVAIDEKSIATFGRFPWPRQVLARTIEDVAAAQPKAIAVDVLFPDPAGQEEDDSLARAIGNAGNVVLAAQLIDSPVRPGASSWLLPLPSLTAPAAGVGHVNVQVESDGAARQFAVQAADDAGQAHLALPVETVRVAGRVPLASVAFAGRSILVGDRFIPLEAAPAPIVMGESGSRPVQRLQSGRVTIDYIGPASSFDPVTYSVADVIRGVIPADRFRGKYVLIGSTAAGQSDRVASPFVHQMDARADQHGVLMPGVEVLANSLNTILRGRFYSQTGDWAAFLWAALIAATTLLIVERSQGRMEALRLSGALLLLGVAVLLAGYLAFTRLLIVPPLIPAFVALALAAMTALVWRSLAASSRLDASIVRLSQSSGILPAPPGQPEADAPGWLPHGLEWKAHQVEELNARLVERARFVDLALKSVEDGLIVASPKGAIMFANRGAGAILLAQPAALVGQNLFDRLGLDGRDLLSRLVKDRARVEREVEIREGRARQYILRMSAVANCDDPDEPVYGIVASLSDITRQHELQNTKNDVIALVSHEMRTPLTAIQGMTELLANYEIDADRRKEISAAINDEVKRLTAMITEYLDLTRLEAGATAIRKAPVRMEPFLQRIVLLSSPVAARRGIRISLDVEPSLPVVFADSDLLGRAVENLISNAIKYSPDATRITIAARKDGDHMVVAISDQGYGVPEEEQARIFEKFYRVPRMEDSGVPGTGLGLALVREILEVHGGTVAVVSKVNAGSTFTIRLPLAESDRPDSTLEKVVG